MVQITKDPELRYTADSQLPVAEMIVEFPNVGVNNKPALLKVVTWRDLAEQVNEKYHQGDYVIVEGRLNINTIERPEGFKDEFNVYKSLKIMGRKEVESRVEEF